MHEGQFALGHRVYLAEQELKVLLRKQWHWPAHKAGDIVLQGIHLGQGSSELKVQIGILPAKGI